MALRRKDAFSLLLATFRILAMLLLLLVLRESAHAIREAHDLLHEAKATVERWEKLANRIDAYIGPEAKP